MQELPALTSAPFLRQTCATRTSARPLCLTTSTTEQHRACEKGRSALSLSPALTPQVAPVHRIVRRVASPVASRAGSRGRIFIARAPCRVFECAYCASRNGFLWHQYLFSVVSTPMTFLANKGQKKSSESKLRVYLLRTSPPERALASSRSRSRAERALAIASRASSARPGSVHLLASPTWDAFCERKCSTTR